jgi:hypothetical protein
MTPAIADANDLVRAAVKMRREQQAAGKPVEEWYDVAQAVAEPMPEVAKAEKTEQPTIGYDAAEEKLAQFYRDQFADFSRQLGDGITHEQPVTVAEQTLQGAIEAVRDRHTKYGPPREHFTRTAALVNAAFGTTFTPADWALVMVLDKVARLRGPTPTTDGGIDIAGYGSCYEECRSCG